MPPRRFAASLRPSLAIALALVLASALACGESAEEPSRDAEPEVDLEAPASEGEPGAAQTAVAPPLGLWVLAEGSQRVLEHPERVGDLLRDARALGATDLFVQVYRQGKAWFDSTLADAAPYRRARERLREHTRVGEAEGAGAAPAETGDAGLDPLALLIRRVQAEGLRVHAWVNVLSLAGNRDALILQDLGRDAVHVDHLGRSLLDYPGLDVPPPGRRWVRMGTPAVWLDPAAPGVAERLVATFAELAARYPELDGLHLDYIRYPDVLPFSPGSRFGVGLQLGYGAASRARFEAETGLRVPDAQGRGHADAWDDWRRRQVTDLVGRIGEAARAERPGLLLSAAVTAYPARAYLSLFQNWRGWLEADLLDFAVVMLYSRDDALFRQEAHAYTGGIGGDAVWLGLGSWLFADAPGRALGQIEVARSAGPAGLALFSWDSIADAPALRGALAEATTEGAEGAGRADGR